MAWEIISKSTVAELIGVSSSILRDEWYDIAVALIERYTGRKNIASPRNIVESHYVWDTPIITVRNPPILQVGYIKIEGTLLPTNAYSWTQRQILFDSGKLNLHERRHVEVGYVSGTTDTDFAVGACIAFVVKELANMRTMEGAESLIQFYKPGRSTATEEPLREWGQHGKIKGIIEAFLGRKLNAI
jgi:hypothetical protein